jgi:hypothetical protein
MIELDDYDYIIEGDVGIKKLMEDTEKRMMNKDINITVLGVVTKYLNKYLVGYIDMPFLELMKKGFAYYLEDNIFDDPHTVAFSASIIGPNNIITISMVREPPNKLIRSSKYKIIGDEKVIINTIVKTRDEIGFNDKVDFMSKMNIKEKELI